MRFRKLLLVPAALVALALLAAVVLPSFFNPEGQRGILASRLEASLGRKVKLGKIRLSLLPPALRVDDTEIAEALGFTGPAFSTAKQLRARVRLFPLLRGRLEVPSVDLEEPTVQLIKNQKGEWNFASLGNPVAGPGAAAGARASSPSTPLEIGKLIIRNGTLTVTDLQKRQPTVIFKRIFLTVKNFSREKPFDWELSVEPPGPAGPKQPNIETSGSGGPLNPANLAQSAAQGEAKFENVDLGALAAFTEQPGLAGLFNGDAKFSSDGKTARAEGSYRVERLRLGPRAGVAQAPVSGKFQLLYDSVANRLNLQQFQLGSGSAVAHTTGQLLFNKLTTADLETRVSNAPLADVARLLPAFGVSLPAGSTLSGGTLNAQMRVRGPVQQPSRRGNLDVRNARLANYNLAGQLGSVVRLAGVDTGGKDTVIEQFKTSFMTERAYTSTKDLLLAIPGLNITGDGGFSEAGNLNFQGLATLTRASGAVGGLLQKVTGSSNTVPFKVGGTLEHPAFQPDVGRMAAQRLEEKTGGTSGGKLLKGLGGIFGKK